MTQREKIFWLTLGTVYVVGLIALIPAHGEICKDGAKTGEEACTSYSLLPFVFIKIGQALDALGVAITALATIAIAWFTWSLRRSTDKLWDAGERQLKLLDDTSAAQSRDMQASVAAAEAAVSVAQDTARRQLRAYVCVAGLIRTKDPGEPDGPGFAIWIDVKNVGQTPAYDLFHWAKIDVREFPLNGGFDIYCVESPSRCIISSGDKNIAFTAFKRDLTPLEEQAILANGKAIYVYGEIDYRDIFGKRYINQFRFRCNGQGYPIGLFKADGEGNEAT